MPRGLGAFNVNVNLNLNLNFRFLQATWRCWSFQ